MLWVLAGFFGGVIVSRNAEPMAAPAFSAVVLGCLLMACVTWFGGNRGKAAAVATAVATAVAEAEAHAESTAVAIAQQAVNVTLNGLGYGATIGEAEPAEGASSPAARSLAASGLLLPNSLQPVPIRAER